MFDISSFIDHIAFYRDLSNDFDDWEDVEEKLKELENEALELLFTAKEIESGQKKVTVSVIGDFSSGKSSFINSLLGQKVCPVGVNPVTSSITRFIYSDTPQIIQKVNGRHEAITPDIYKNLVNHKKSTKNQQYSFDYYYPFEGLRHLELYDTPGFANPKNPNDKEITLQATKNSDVIFFLIDINKGEIAKDILNILEEIRKDSPKTQWYLIINKSDLKGLKGGKRIFEKCQSSYPAFFRDVFLYSSKENARGDGWKEVEKNVIEYLKENVNSNDSINTTISGRKTGKKYTFYFNGKSISVPYHYNTETRKSKDEIIKILHYIGEEKDKYSKSNFVKQCLRYKKKIDNYLSKITEKLDLKATSSNKKNNEVINELGIDDVINSCTGEFSHCLRINLEKMILDSLITVEVDEEEKPYWWYPYYKVEFSKINVRGKMYDFQVWNIIEEKLNDFIADLQDLNLVNQTEETIKRPNFNYIKEISTDKIYNLTHNIWQDKFNGKYYRDKETPNNLKKEIIDQMKSSKFKDYIDECKKPLYKHLLDFRDDIHKNLYKSAFIKEGINKSKIIAVNKARDKIRDFQQEVDSFLQTVPDNYADASSAIKPEETALDKNHTASTLEKATKSKNQLSKNIKDKSWLKVKKWLGWHDVNQK